MAEILKNNPTSNSQMEWGAEEIPEHEGYYGIQAWVYDGFIKSC
jgi:hypothetical protein